MAPFGRMLAARDLVDGAAQRAARGFARARRLDPGDPGLLLVEAYARCRAGRCPETGPLLERVRALGVPELSQAAEWIARTFSGPAPVPAPADGRR
jgi:hypothetical protein